MKLLPANTGSTCAENNNIREHEHGGVHDVKYLMAGKWCGNGDNLQTDVGGGEKGRYSAFECCRSGVEDIVGVRYLIDAIKVHSSKVNSHFLLVPSYRHRNKRKKRRQTHRGDTNCREGVEGVGTRR